MQPSPRPWPIRLQAGALDPDAGVMRRDGERIELGRLGAALLRILSRELGVVVSVEALCAELWPGRAGQERALSVAVHRLRAKLELDPLHPVHLRTVRGEGYVLSPTPDAPAPAPAGPGASLALVDGAVDLAAGVVRRDGVRTELGTAELAVLRALVDADGPVPREVLKTRVLGYRASTRSRAADATVTRLRRKLERDPEAPVHLVTVRGRGLQWVPAEAPAAPLQWERPRVGRAAELTALQQLLDAHRLVTVTGPPGVGKSRLAAAAAARAFGRAGVRVDASLGLVEAVCSALGLQGVGAPPRRPGGSRGRSRAAAPWRSCWTAPTRSARRSTRR
ncbi:MAG: winged helix-turn-helix domain-containing protein [Myxococcota bacterium]